jgi:hypothetical protein
MEVYGRVACEVLTLSTYNIFRYSFMLEAESTPGP